MSLHRAAILNWESLTSRRTPSRNRRPGAGVESFWETAPDPLAAILRNVKGSDRRKMIRDYYAAGKFDELRNELFRDRWDT